MIPKDTISKIFDATRIEEVIGDFVQLKKSGSSYKGLSPFVSEKTPSFYVVPAKGIFKDFSSGKGGSAVTFLMEHEKLSYPDALRYLAKKYNIEVAEEELSPEQRQVENERESLYLLLKYAQDYFADYMWSSDEGQSVGLGYFRERGFTDETIKKFNLGYHPEGRDKFTKTALDKGYQQAYLEKLGLTKSREGKLFDFFHGRVMFPIQNLTGRTIGFGGRVLRTDNKAIAKYFNSPESELYNKSKTLYGIFQAKNRIVAEDLCYLVEGYTDVLAMNQAGVENTVASSGTSLTLEQIQLIKRYTPNITILYDGDAAGIRASFRGIDMILEAGMNVKVVLFPDGDDPDSYSRKVSSEVLKTYLKEAAQDFISFKTSILLKDAGNDPIRRAQLIQEIIQSVTLVPDAILRSTYLRATSQLMDVQEQVLINELNKQRSKNIKKDARQAGDEQDIPVEAYITQRQEIPTEDNIAPNERELVRLLLNYGHLSFDFVHVDEETGLANTFQQNVREFVVETLQADEVVFEDELLKKIYELLQEEEYKLAPQNIANHSDQSIANLAADLLTNPHQISEGWISRQHVETPTEEAHLERTIKNALYAYLLKRIDMMINQIRQELKLVDQEDGDAIVNLMVSQIEYERAKAVFSKELERVILR